MKFRFRKVSGVWLCRTPTMIYLFTDRGFALLHENYKLGNSSVTEKGLQRYCGVWAYRYDIAECDGLPDEDCVGCAMAYGYDSGGRKEIFRTASTAAHLQALDANRRRWGKWVRVGQAAAPDRTHRALQAVQRLLRE